MVDYKLLLTFAGGEFRVFDVAPYLSKGVFRALREKPLFDAVRISFDTIAWPNGADFCPEVLYLKSQPVAPDEVRRLRMGATCDTAEARS